MRLLKIIKLILVSLITLISACSFPPLNDEEHRISSDYTYQIGPGDTLNIFVWGNPDISTIIPVRPDGKVTIPLVEDVLASGKTPNQLARELEKAFTEFIRDPQVVVMLTAFQGVDAQQIRIVGQIGESSGDSETTRFRGLTIPYERGMTLLDVIIRIGSIGEFADGNRASIIRRINGVQKQFGVRIEDLVEDGDMTENVSMLPGDILIVPEAFF